MHKHKAQQDASGVYSLIRDNVFCICPKTAIVVPQQNRLHPSQVEMQERRNPCNTGCPFAQVKEISEIIGSDASQKQVKDIYEISCEGRVNQIELDEIIEFKKSDTPIVSMGDK
jgi:hypothetical protein